MKHFFIAGLVTVSVFISSWQSEGVGDKQPADSVAFRVMTEHFADIAVLRYQVPGFDQLTLQQKKLCYYLSQAALSGRDIIYDQDYKENLRIRKTLEAIINDYKGDTASADWKKFMVYTKRFWFSNGIHHHYSNNKFFPEFSKDFFISLVKQADAKKLPMERKQTVEQFGNMLATIIFSPEVAPKKVNLDPKADMIQTSAINFYEGVTQGEVTKYYDAKTDKKNSTPPSYGLNSKLVKENGQLIEKQWKTGGMYSSSIKKIVYWLQKASGVAENAQQKKVIDLLIAYYKSGDLKKFDEYSIEWVKDTASVVDFVNGFIEVYNDPLGYRGSYESVVSIKDFEASKRIKAIGEQAQWFEDNSPIMTEHKKKDVKGISAKVINVVTEAGDAAPSTPIGINLPNAEWIREHYGSKSVNLGNIVEAYNQAGKSGGMLEEFYSGDDVIRRLKQYSPLAGKLHTDMHEVIGHASGKVNEGVGTSKETLLNYASTLEEARADLVALYYILDKKLVDMGVMPSLEVGKAEYDSYINNGLMVQLTRLPIEENQLEEAHMRNRQLIAAWVFENGTNDNVISKIQKDGKTFFVINNYEKLRELFGQLLREVQRVKSEGDYKAGQALVENYGVKVDPALHKEVLDRYSKLHVAPYKGFIQPKLVPVMNGKEITDVKIEYPESFMEQMLQYGKEYSFLPVKN